MPEPESEPRSDRELVRATLGGVFLLVLVGTVFWILRPLLPAILWSSAIVVSTWPVLVWLERRLGGRRAIAAALLTAVLTLLLLLPFLLAVVGILDNAQKISDGVQSLSEAKLPPPPTWLKGVPLVGEDLSSRWQLTTEEGGEGLLARVAPYANRLVKWLLGQLGSVGRVIFLLVLTLIGVVFLYRSGDVVAARIRRFAERIAGEQGGNAMRLAAQATRSVALGVIMTAVVQALLAGLGLLAAGVPSAGLLTAVMIASGLAQLGPMPVLLPAVAWLYWQGAIGWATALLVWSGFVSVVDNLLRPFLIRLGADLSAMLVFVGVIGGLVAFGVVGLFIGPVVLAVAYRLLEDWVGREDPSGSQAPAGPEATGG